MQNKKQYAHGDSCGYVSPGGKGDGSGKYYGSNMSRGYIAGKSDGSGIGQGRCYADGSGFGSGCRMGSCFGAGNGEGKGDG